MQVMKFEMISQEILPTPPARILRSPEEKDEDDVNDDGYSENYATLLLSANLKAGSRLKSDALLTRVTLDALNSDDLTTEIKEADDYFEYISVRCYKEKPDLSELLPEKVYTKIKQDQIRETSSPMNFNLIIIVLVAATAVVAFVVRIPRSLEMKQEVSAIGAPGDRS